MYVSMYVPMSVCVDVLRAVSEALDWHTCLTFDTLTNATSLATHVVPLHSGGNGSAGFSCPDGDNEQLASLGSISLLRISLLAAAGVTLGVGVLISMHSGRVGKHFRMLVQ
jgi:hypothetical protein